jgi:lipoprotein-releasing system ATP-binding protein
MNEPLVVCRNLFKGFPSGHTRIEVLLGLDLEVRRGALVAVTGDSGAGKSTLLHLVAGLDVPDRGEIAVGGRMLSAMEAGERSQFRNRGIGMVFQFHYLLPEFSALENVVLPRWMLGGRRDSARPAAAALLCRLGLKDRLDHRPSQLSGGEQQRVAIARALINSPMLLLADEPTGNLDARTADSVFDCLRGLNREENLTVILATHNPRFAERCDRVFHLQQGRIDAAVDRVIDSGARLGPTGIGAVRE